MPAAASRYPADWPAWVPKELGIQETVAPFRFVGADVLQSYDATKLWLGRRSDVNKGAFGTAWIRFLCRDLKAARLSAVKASRALKAARPKAPTTKSKRPARTLNVRNVEIPEHAQRHAP